MLSILKLIVDAAAVLVGGTLLLRFWMQAIRVRPPSSVAHFTFALSDWLVRPMRRIIPGVGGYDWATLIAAYLVLLVATTVYLLQPGMTVEAMFILSVYRFLNWIIYGWMILMIFEAILSWVNPHAPVAPFVRALNEPLLRPLRRMIPLVGGLDLSMLVAVILLQILQILLSMVFGYR